MSYRKEIMTAAGTLCCAIGIGFVMQGSDSAKNRYGETETVAASEAKELGSSVLLSVKDITLTSAEVDRDLAPVVVPVPETAVTPVSAPVDQMPKPDTEATPAVAPADVAPMSKPVVIPASAPVEFAPQYDTRVNVVAESECEISATARAKAAAMVDLELSAPCLPMERVTVHHGGMIFMQMTDSNGAVNVTIPALAKQAVFILAFSNGEGAVAQTMVEEIGEFDRVALQWKGETGFGIHAREYGADYGEDGHIWAGNTGAIATAVTGGGGYLTVLGDASIPDGMTAEVYTFPTGAAGRAGDVDLSVEAEVTEANCGSEVEAKTLQILRGADIQARNLTLSVPECDAEGSFLLLNNLFEDLKVAGS